MTALVERLVMGSGAGPSVSRLTSLSVSGVSATEFSPSASRVPSDVEPGCDPVVLDGEQQPQHELYREQEQNRDGEELERHVLEQARAVEQLALERARRHQPRLEAPER